jgi:autotransporter-associated beta strand protein
MKSASAIEARKRVGALAVLLSSTCLTIAPAWAQDATWTGATSTNWNTGSNWSTGSVPTGTATFAGSPGSTPNLVTFSQSTTIQAIRFSGLSALGIYQFSQLQNLQIVGAGIFGSPNSFFSAQTHFDVDQPGTTMSFRNSSTAGEATIEARRGGAVRFFDTSPGGFARLGALAGGIIDISTLTSNGMTAGSIFGDENGMVFLGSKKLTVDGLTDGFPGVISDGGQGGGTGGSLTITNFQILSGANTYTGGTTIGPGGTLQLGVGGTTGSIVGNVVNNGRLVFNRTDLQTFAGAISGTGRVDFGGGTIILTGNNTYTGNSINFGAFLQIGNGGTTGSIIGNIRNDATFAIRRSNTFVFDGVMSGPLDSSGTGNFQQLGTGTTILNGANTYTGTTTVNAGTLSVNGSIASSSLTTVNAGATLGGNGTVGNTTINGGTLAPGSSIGTLTVQGNLVFTAAASYMVEVSPANADRTNVTGTATLGGATVRANFAPGTYVVKQYTIVNATGGVIGTFGGPANTDLPAGFQTGLSYDANNRI